MFPKILLRLFAIVYLVRFAMPALIFASSGGPFGVPWLDDGNKGTLLLDSDIRYWGMTCASISVLFAVASFDVARHRLAVDVIMAGALAGGLMRTIELIFVGVHPLPGVVAMILEYAFPIAWFLSTRKIPRPAVERT
jgi:uncharacterized protein DUF4345